MEEIKIDTPTFYSDERGELWSVWNKSEFNPQLIFNHDKVAKSKKGVLRGFHGDNKSWKLITCLYGEIFLSVVDYRKNSKSFLETKNFILNDKNKKTILVPPNFLNAHQVLSDEAVFFYKWSYDGNYPDVDEQFSVNWNDPKINVDWPIKIPILSERDKHSKFINFED